MGHWQGWSEHLVLPEKQYVGQSPGPDLQILLVRTASFTPSPSCEIWTMAEHSLNVLKDSTVSGCVYKKRMHVLIGSLVSDSVAAEKHNAYPAISKKKINFSTDKNVFEMNMVPMYLKIHGKTQWILSSSLRNCVFFFQRTQFPFIWIAGSLGMTAWTAIAAFGILMARHYKPVLGRNCLGEEINRIFAFLSLLMFAFCQMLDAGFFWLIEWGRFSIYDVLIYISLKDLVHLWDARLRNRTPMIFFFNIFLCSIVGFPPRSPFKMAKLRPMTTTFGHGRVNDRSCLFILFSSHRYRHVVSVPQRSNDSHSSCLRCNHCRRFRLRERMDIGGHIWGFHIRKRNCFIFFRFLSFSLSVLPKFVGIKFDYRKKKIGK